MIIPKYKHVKIIYTNSEGKVVYDYDTHTFFVYEKLHEGYGCFEVPSVDDGVEYLRSIINERNQKRNN